MKNFLNSETREELRRRHRIERDRRVADRIKAVLLSDRGWTYIKISEALMVDEETVSLHIEEYLSENKLKPENGGSSSKLTPAQAEELEAHLEEVCYVKAEDICAYIESKYGVKYTVSGLTDWLHAHNFSYKEPKGVPAKADPIQQEAFIQAYETLEKEACEKDEPILFLDAVHPTMATKIERGWIRKGKDKLIETIASRTRMNLIGVLNLSAMSVHVESFETINSDSIVVFLEQIRQQHPNGVRIHIILDQGSYNTSSAAKEAAEKNNIVLHFLPPYSPNLNSIERLWKLMNEHVRNNVVFKTAKEFKESIMNFFNCTWSSIAQSMTDRINDNFQRIKSPS